MTRSVPFVCSRPGSWIAATVQIPPANQVTAVAMYGLMDEFSDASVHRSLSEASPVLDDPRYRQQVLIGGDLNTGTQWPAAEPFIARDLNLLQRFEALGLVDCLAAMRPAGRLEGCGCTFGDGCTHTRTRRDPRWPDVPYQTDYLWASERLATRLVSSARERRLVLDFGSHADTRRVRRELRSWHDRPDGTAPPNEARESQRGARLEPGPDERRIEHVGLVPTALPPLRGGAIVAAVRLQLGARRRSMSSRKWVPACTCGAP